MEIYVWKKDGTSMGFEPTTLGTTIRCSNLLSYDVRVFLRTGLQR